MKKFTFKFATKYKYIVAKTIKDAFMQLSKTDKLKFKSVHCDDTGLELSEAEVFGLFGYEIPL